MFMANLKQLRELKGLSQEKLAEKVGVSMTFVAHIETGRKSPSFETLELLGEALGVHPYRLLVPPMPAARNSRATTRKPFTVPRGTPFTPGPAYTSCT